MTPDLGIGRPGHPDWNFGRRGTSERGRPSASTCKEADNSETLKVQFWQDPLYTARRGVNTNEDEDGMDTFSSRAESGISLAMSACYIARQQDVCL